jgi:type I restriction enzyme, S subunit
VTSRATLGLVALSVGPIATNQGFKSIIFSGDADPNFYYHLFKTLKPEMARRASGTTFLEISGKEFSEIVIPLPPKGEQRRIAEILDALDDQIRETEQILAKQSWVRQGLIEDLVQKNHSQEGQIYSLSELLVPGPFGSSIGPFGSNLVASDYRSSGIPVVFVRDIQSGELVWKSSVYVTPQKARALDATSV